MELNLQGDFNFEIPLKLSTVEEKTVHKDLGYTQMENRIHLELLSCIRIYNKSMFIPYIVYVELKKFLYSNTKVFPSIAKIEQDTKICKKSIISALHFLAKHGFIYKKSHGKGRKTEYYFLREALYTGQMFFKNYRKELQEQSGEDWNIIYEQMILPYCKLVNKTYEELCEYYNPTQQSSKLGFNNDNF